eukprot:GHVL01029919.1.p1 GENE.GHVL01029919.1~~GHVL01029919.1.p1  ORF type:complete len:156 (+),score=25.37 GHVL01029919.1:554-1021(+)
MISLQVVPTKIHLEDRIDLLLCPKHHLQQKTKGDINHLQTEEHNIMAQHLDLSKLKMQLIEREAQTARLELEKQLEVAIYNEEKFLREKNKRKKYKDEIQQIEEQSRKEKIFLQNEFAAKILMLKEEVLINLIFSMIMSPAILKAEQRIFGAEKV